MVFPSLAFTLFPTHPGIFLVPWRTRADDHSYTTFLFPREPHTTLLLSPYLLVLEEGVGDPLIHGIQSHSSWRRGCCFQNRRPESFTVLSGLLCRTCLRDGRLHLSSWLASSRPAGGSGV